MDTKPAITVATLVDDIEGKLKIKPDGLCQYKIDCCNEAFYVVSEHHGIDPNNVLKMLVCPEHIGECRKEGRDWGDQILVELLPGKKEPEVIKKRGRPKNAL